MQERVRICDIAEELGLSTATVSNVIHGKTNKVSDETVQRVTALLEKRQYIPSMAGILLARNSSGIIGVFVNDHPKYEGHTLRDGFLASVLLPLFVCEASWSLGENVYAAIYGRMGTEQSAAMTLTAPIQGLVIGALCGLSQAAGVIVGKRLGGEDYDGAYRAAKRLMVYGAVGASVLCAVVLLTSGAYVEIYQVSRYRQAADTADSVCLCAGRAVQGAQYDPWRRHSPQRRADGLCHGHRYARHVGLRRPAGTSGRVCLEAAHRVRLSAPVAGGMHPLRNLHGGLPPQTLDETAWVTADSIGKSCQREILTQMKV